MARLNYFSINELMCGYGAIILMHDGAESGGNRTNTIESLHQIIPTDQGYGFVTVPELLNIPFKN